MKITINTEPNDNLSIYSENKQLGIINVDTFLSILDSFQVDAYEDGEVKFSVNEVKLFNKLK
jgi:hypothetical protein